MINLVDVAWLGTLVLLGMWFWRARGARELALLATRRYCEQHAVQLLDDTVALRGFGWKRDAHGRLRPWRAFAFEFTATGDERYRGRTLMLGNRLERVELPPHRF